MEALGEAVCVRAYGVLYGFRAARRRGSHLCTKGDVRRYRPGPIEAFSGEQTSGLPGH